ncbi:MAG TPA: family 16 glycoside hydrolase [Chloroflexota bacterium]|nr:family 16 glycoside hydrolase [Chloroflexota bacterium]
MVSPGSPRAPVQEADASSPLARGLSLLLLVAIFLAPFVAIGVASVWYWSALGGRMAPGSGASSPAYAPAPGAADLRRVAENDQGIDFSATVRGGTFPLKEMSTGRLITQEGEPVYVRRDGTRVPLPVLFRDDFTTPGSGWESAARVGWYEDGAYRLVTTAVGTGSEYARHTQQFGDFFMRTDARLDRPTQGVYLYLGFRFRHLGQGGEGYVFAVTPDDGTFRLELWQQGGRARTALIGNTTSPAVYGGTSWNRLGVLAEGPEIQLLLNGQVVGRARDETFPTGTLALGVGVQESALAFSHGDARFTQLVVLGLN